MAGRGVAAGHGHCCAGRRQTRTGSSARRPRERTWCMQNTRRGTPCCRAVQRTLRGEQTGACDAGNHPPPTKPDLVPPRRSRENRWTSGAGVLLVMLEPLLMSKSISRRSADKASATSFLTLGTGSKAFGRRARQTTGHRSAKRGLRKRPAPKSARLTLKRRKMSDIASVPLGRTMARKPRSPPTCWKTRIRRIA